MSDRILCIGEILWDIFPSGKFIGGAPFNVAYHLNQLGLSANILSRIGNDELGTKALKEIKDKGLSEKFVQIDNRYPTGTVEVKISDDGDAAYNIVEPVAWDFIEVTDEILKEISNYTYLVYGSLAYRNNCSLKHLQKLSSTKITKVLDLNLRHPFYSEALLKELILSADIVKMNLDEYNLLSDWFGLNTDLESGMIELEKMFMCKIICITLGRKGAVIYRNNCFNKHDGYDVKVQDTVGAGDAFLAAMLKGIIDNMKNEEILKFANSVGSFVASKSGGTPKINSSLLKE